MAAGVPRCTARVGNGFIRVDRARAAVRLIGEVRELGVCTEPGRQHLVHGLLDVVGCAIGGLVHDVGYGPGLKAGIAQATLAGFDHEIMAVFEAHHTHGSDYNPYHGAMMQRLDQLRAGDVFTSSNSELVARAD